jgi:CRISPR-associated protein Cas1
MRRLLNTVYVTADDAWLRKDGANLVVETQGEETGRVPLHLLEGLVGFTRLGCSPALMHACAEAGITMSFVDPTGRFLARVEGPRSGNVLLRRAQYRHADDDAKTLGVLRSIVSAKAANQRTVLKRAVRDHGQRLGQAASAEIDAATARLAFIAKDVLSVSTADVARGREGEAAALYFSVFDHLVLAEKPALQFNGRSRRPPMDRINALLSFFYAMLGHDCRSALEAHGLDPQVGFLHADRPGRPSLALDLMEDLRPVLADRLTLSLVNRAQLTADDFVVEEAGGVRLTDNGRRQALVAWQERKRESVRHPFFDESVPLGLFPYLQAQLMARHIRGELDGYPALIWR